MNLIPLINILTIILPMPIPGYQEYSLLGSLIIITFFIVTLLGIAIVFIFDFFDIPTRIFLWRESRRKRKSEKPKEISLAEYIEQNGLGPQLNDNEGDTL